MTLEESIKNSLKKVIKEELGISDTVKITSQNIMNKICDDIVTNFKVLAKEYKRGVKIYKFNIKDIIIIKNISYKISCNIQYYNFINNDIYEQEKYNINCDYAYSSSDGKRINIINIFCYGICGQINKESLYSSIQHEIEHIYQGIIGNNRITTFDNLYSLASQHLIDDNKAIMYMANIIYYSYDYEQDGYVNGLYGELMSNEINIPKWEDIKGSSAYVGLAMLRKSLRIIKKNIGKTKVISAADFFNVNLNTVINQGKKAEKRFLNKIGKILIKVKQDKEQQGIKIESTKPWIFNYFLD